MDKELHDVIECLVGCAKITPNGWPEWPRGLAAYACTTYSLTRSLRICKLED